MCTQNAVNVISETLMATVAAASASECTMYAWNSPSPSAWR